MNLPEGSLFCLTTWPGPAVHSMGALLLYVGGHVYCFPQGHPVLCSPSSHTQNSDLHHDIC